MKRILILLAALAAVTAAAAPARAAGFTGVVVAKDDARRAVVTASANGTVRTTRSPKARSLRIGQRLQVTGARLADGTYRAASIRVSGRTAKVKVRAVVVHNQRAQRRLVVSAGGSTFALSHRSAARVTASRSGGSPAAGDEVVATVALASGTAQATSVTTVGHVGTVEVEGIITKLADGSVELLVAHAGYVTVSLPAGFVLPVGLKVFDELELVVSVSADGKLTAVSASGDDEDDEHADDEDDDEDDDNDD